MRTSELPVPLEHRQFLSFALQEAERERAMRCGFKHEGDSAECRNRERHPPARLSEDFTAYLPECWAVSVVYSCPKV